jgi:hypothetical protein
VAAGALARAQAGVGWRGRILFFSPSVVPFLLHGSAGLDCSRVGWPDPIPWRPDPVTPRRGATPVVEAMVEAAATAWGTGFSALAAGSDAPWVGSGAHSGRLLVHGNVWWLSATSAAGANVSDNGR